MSLEANNNRKIIYRLAKSNLMGNKLYSFFSFASIILSVAFVSAMFLFLLEKQAVEKRMLGQMQHVMFMNVQKEQMKEIESDPRTEEMVPYKESGQTFWKNGIKYSFIYLENREGPIRTYALAEGCPPKKQDEVVVDKRFMDSIGQECKTGGKIWLDVGDSQQEFAICGYTDKGYDTSSYSVYVSGAFADQSVLMKDLAYTALVRIVDAALMDASGFETTVYQMAMDHSIGRSDVNRNGRFEESLQGQNAVLYAAGLLVAAFVLAACGIVIYSIFYLSVTSRTQQIGQLQTIGMTPRQAKKMVRREGVLLGGLAIPLGLAFGSMTAYVLEPEGFGFWNWVFVAVIVGIVGMAVVQISLGKPAALAAGVSPVEAARNTVQKETLKEGIRKHKRLSPFVLAKLGQEGSRKKRNLMTVSLAFGGVVFMIAASYLCAWDEAAFSRQGKFENAEYVVSYLYSAHNPSAYGPTKMQLTGHLSEALKEELLGIAHIRSIEVESSAFGNVEYQGAVWGEGFLRVTGKAGEYFGMEADKNTSYAYMCGHDAVVITDSAFKEAVNGVSFRAGDKFTLHWFDGQEREAELEIAAVTPDSMPGHSDYSVLMADKTMEKLWGGMNTASSFTISTQEYEKYGDQIEQAIRAAIAPYEDLGLETLRERRINDSASVRKVKIQIYGIYAFMLLFSVLNLINMLVGNIAVKKRGLSMLESIGMEEGQIQKMLFWESIQFVFPAVAITLLLGGTAGYGFVWFMQKNVHYMEYRFPVAAGILYAAGVMLLPVAISYAGLKVQRRIPLVERI